MSQIEETKENLGDVDPERIDEDEPVLERDDPEYVPRSKGARVLAWILAVVVMIGVILYLCWISGIIHE